MRVDGVGPAPCDICVVGEGPGYAEDRTGKPFVGKTGDELDRFLDGQALPTRRQVFLTNIFREYHGKDYVWTKEDQTRDEPMLIRELQRVLPKTIVTLGRYATRYFLGEVDMDSTQSLPWYLPETCDAYPCPPEGVVIFPIVHPAAGMHNPEMSPYVVAGFAALAAYLDGRIAPRTLFDDPIKDPRYEEILSAQHLTASLSGLTGCSHLSLDTEGWPGNPWSLQYAYAPGTGYLIRANRPDLLQQFQEILRRTRPTLAFHSALHDLGMGRALHIDLSGLPFDDSMVMAYLLQLEPQGLKPGCLRHCNMRMSDYTDILGDVSNDLARDYLTWLWDLEQVEYDEACQAELIRLQTTPYVDSRGTTHPGRRVRKAPSLPKTPLHRAVSRVLQSKRPRSLWEDQVEDLQVAGYRRLGPLPAATLDYIAPEVAIPYGCRDADGTIRLLPEYDRRIDALGLRDVYKLELSTYPLIDRMQQIGVKPDLEHFAALSTLLAYEIGELQTALVAQTGDGAFNANSGDQVAAYLFGRLGMDTLKMTKGGRGSTNDKILEALEHEHPEHPVITTIRQYREFYKLKHTFVDRLPDFVHRWPYDGRVHATFRTTRVVTGRLAASDPNLLALPKHGAFAKEFRRGFVPEDGHVLGSWDLSQIELRIAAHLSQDPVMLATYRGEKRNPDGSLIDLHAALAQRIFGVQPSLQDDSKHRLPAKAINFGFWMGQTAKGLLVELRKNGLQTSEDDAQRWLDDAHELYAGARPYMDHMAAEAREHGYVRCMSGRIRYIGGIRSQDERVREEAERFAFSTPIQEGAQTVMKTNEAVLWRDIICPLQAAGYWIEPLLQIHDDLVLEMQEDIVREVAPMMVQCMTQSYEGLSVPIKTSSSAGSNWCDMVSIAS